MLQARTGAVQQLPLLGPQSGPETMDGELAAHLRACKSQARVWDVNQGHH